jgi:mannose-1-phosphate guanylyltransferase
MTRQDTFVVITLYSSKSANFWPYTRKHKPKPFLDLLGSGKTLLQHTYERSKGICPEDNIYVLVPREYKELLREQLPQLSNAQILEEPVRRNSAPSIAYAAYKIKKKYTDAVIVVTPADHAVLGEIAFIRDVRKAVEIASNDRENLIIIGKKPQRPDTNYGYIQYHLDGNATLKRIKTFTKKPQEELAKLFLESGDFAWNTKIYIWHVDAILNALDQYAPEVSETFGEGVGYYFTEDENQFVYKSYAHCSHVSISNNVLEKTDKILLLLGEFDWSDLSDWEAFCDLKQQPEEGNIVEANAYIHDTEHCLIKGDEHKLIVVEGLNKFLVVDSKDVLLICPMTSAANIRNLTSTIKKLKNDKYL